jgi:hypothetical protein
MIDVTLLIAVRIAITVLWTIITGAGTVAAFQNTSDARRDKRNLLARRPRVNGVLLLEANGGISDQSLIFWAICTDFLSGLIAMVMIVLLPPQPTTAGAVASFTGSAVGILLTAGAVALTRLSFEKKRRRKLQMQKMLLALEKPEGT